MAKKGARRFPNWFSPYSKGPTPPGMPEKVLTPYQREQVVGIGPDRELEEYTTYALADVIPEGATHVYIARCNQTHVTVVFGTKAMPQPNPEYAQLWAKYQDDLKEFERRKAQWPKLRAAYAADRVRVLASQLAKQRLKAERAQAALAEKKGKRK